MEGDPFLPGFHFHPTDVDLVQYLKRKVMGERLHFEFITEIDVYKFDPWDLPEKSVFCPSDWYFFCPRDWKYSNGSRTIRVTENGFWKPTGNDKPIFHNTRKVGNKRRLVFHMGCAPKGDITNWVMHKYSLEDKDLVDAGIFQDAYSLCRIFEKSDPGPKNGEQCGAPFRDEDWDDVANDSLDSFSLANLGSSSSRVLPDERNIPMVKATGIVDMGGSLLEPLPRQIRLSNANEVLPSLQEDDDVASLLSIFDNEDDALVSNDKDRNEKPASLNVDEGIDLDGFGIYTGLEAFNSQSELKAVDGFRFHSSLETEDAPSQNFLGDEMLFLELNDLESPVGYPPEDNSSESSDCSSLDDIYAHHNEYNNSEGFCNPLDAGLSASGVSMTHSLCPEGSQVEDQLALFLEYEDFEGDVNCGYEAANPVPYSGEEAEERGNRNVQQVMARGEEEGSASDSVLQYLLESIPARSASAAEHPSPTNGEKTSKGKSLLSPYGGSSVHVEAEVTVRCGHTRDAFSDELEKLPCMTYGRTLLRREPRKRVATRSSGFKFVFLLGMVTALFWLILLVFSVQFCRYAWNRLLS